MARAKTSITMDEDLLREARAYGINLSDAAAKGIEAVVRAERTERLRAELRPGIEAYNRWIEENGMPFANRRVAFPGIE